MQNNSEIPFIKRIFFQLKKIDLIIWIPIIILAITGILFIYSSSLNVDGQPHNPLQFPKHIKQLIWIFFGLVFTILFNWIHWKDLLLYSLYITPIFFILLLVVLFLPSHNGAYSWIRIGNLSIQPSELFKPFFILNFAWLLTRFKDVISKPFFTILALCIALIPVGLIILQKDMGTASVYLPITFIMIYRGGGNKKILFAFLGFSITLYLITLFSGWAILTGKGHFILSFTSNKIAKITIVSLFFIISILSLIGFIFFKKKYFFWILYISIIFLSGYVFSFFIAPSEKGYGALGKYQIERIVYPIDNSLKVTTSYNIEQARTAIGSGGWIGKGFLKGNLSHRRFVPEQPTDFIFSILAEEWGLLGSLFILVLYIIILFRFLLIMQKIQDNTAQLILSAIFTLFFYHMSINIGMNMGLIPVIGIPLFFISYGGTAIWTAFISIGLFMNISHNS